MAGRIASGGKPVVGRPKGLRVLCRARADWGLGHVLSDEGGAKVSVFFLGGGRRTLDTTIAELDLVTGEAAMNPILDVAERADWQHAHHNLYVVELRAEVVNERTFLEANPGYSLGGRPCVYVGMTGLSPEERFQAHRMGSHSARFVKKYGLRLLPELCKHFNPMPYELAAVMEVELARQLREQGFGVWQN